MNKNNQNGFTIVELLLVMGITAVMTSIGFANYFNYQKRAVIESEGDKMVGYLREAIARARSQQDNTTWAIRIENGASDYYELLGGGVSIGKVYLDTRVTFTATTTSATSTLVGGSTISPVGSQIDIGLITTDLTLSEEITVQTNGKVIRAKNY